MQAAIRINSISGAATVHSRAPPTMKVHLSYDLWTSTSNPANGIYKSNALVYPPVLPVMPLQPINLITHWQRRRSQGATTWTVSGCFASNLISSLSSTESLQGKGRLGCCDIWMIIINMDSLWAICRLFLYTPNLNRGITWRAAD